MLLPKFSISRLLLSVSVIAVCLAVFVYSMNGVTWLAPVRYALEFAFLMLVVGLVFYSLSFLAYSVVNLAFPNRQISPFAGERLPPKIAPLVSSKDE